MQKRIRIAAVVICAAFIAVSARYWFIINDEDIVSASVGRGTYTVNVCRHKGYIYDRNMKPLVNRGSEYYALINPDTFDVEEIYPLIADYASLTENIGGHAPFLCRLKNGDADDPLTPIIETKDRYGSDNTARHIIGYSSENFGGCGVEGLYSDFIGENSCSTRISYSVNALGNVLDGADVNITEEKENTAGVATSLDYDIQLICEEAMKNIGRGAAVVMDVESGDILASVSHPVYDINDLEAYLDDEDSPFVNRAFSAYSVGSVFKLVIAASALESGISEEFSCTCGGKVTIGSNTFSCHKWAGHGKLDMRTATVESCNPYFILLGRNIPCDMLHDFASAAGFGTENDLRGLVSASGYLPTADELSVPAENANFCFGQGRLSATPIQICSFICAAANGGKLPQAQLIYGTVNSSDEKISHGTSSRQIFSEETADKLKSFMRDTLYKDNSVGIPYNTDGGGKTSTAQTGRIGSDGMEELTCWFAGFFPYDEPKYAAVIVAEDGISGNLTCAPVFKEIAENVTEHDLTVK